MLLSEIILIAESPGSYEFSLNFQAKLIDSLCSGSKIFRQGSTITLSINKTVSHTNGQDKHEQTTLVLDDGFVYRFRVLMTEPTLQGFARHNMTRFVVMPSTEVPQTCSANGNNTPPLDNEGTSVPLSESDVETLEIDENFLASGLIGSIPQGIDLLPPNVNSDDVSSESHGLHMPPPTVRRPISGSSPIFQVTPFLAPISHSPESFDAECCIFLRTSDLSRIGMFNGDWVRIHGRNPFAMRRFTTLFDSFRV